MNKKFNHLTHILEKNNIKVIDSFKKSSLAEKSSKIQ